MEAVGCRTGTARLALYLEVAYLGSGSRLTCHLVKPQFTSKSRLILLYNVLGDKGKESCR